MTYESRKCENCGQEYVPTRTWQKYCCRKCYYQANRERELERSRATYSKIKKSGKKNGAEIHKCESLIEVAVKAREAGMSYGQYVALHQKRGG